MAEATPACTENPQLILYPDRPHDVRKAILVRCAFRSMVEKAGG